MSYDYVYKELQRAFRQQDKLRLQQRAGGGAESLHGRRPPTARPGKLHATAARAIEDMKLSGVLTEESILSETSKRLLVGAGLEQEVEVPETTPR